GVVALRAGEVELALPAVEELISSIDRRAGSIGNLHLDRHAAGLFRHESRERQQVAALVAELRRLVAHLLLERGELAIDHRRIARGDALHADGSVLVAALAAELAPQRFAVEQG